MTASEKIRLMPKTEVHLHLEGTISAETLWAMAARNGVALPVKDLDELRGMYVFESFDKFIRLWLLMCSCLKTEGDYTGMVDGFVAECGRQNIRYAELHFTPYNHEKYGIGAKRALEIVTNRLLESEKAGGPVTRLITDIPSEAGQESGDFTAAFLEGIANPLIVAIGLGGPEQGFPRAPFAPFFERARRAGYPCVAHAGETAGADHVRQAVIDLGARRVQHGIRAVEDESVLRLLAERHICCDVALTSNACLTGYSDLKEHPIRRMIDAGVPVTISTDDPPFFGTDLLGEYRRAHEEVGLSLGEIWQANLNGLRFGLADVGLRRRLLQEFEAAGRAIGSLSTP
ncbi:MAG: adenosine deaminase [Spirochaetota bacterium]